MLAGILRALRVGRQSLALRSMNSYRALASEVGCLSAEIYKEIRRCLRLRGGVVVEGVKWIWKTSEELAERLGVNEKTIRRHLKALVQMGWLKREQHQKRWGMRAYHYTLGDHAPLKTGVIAAPVDPLHRHAGGQFTKTSLVEPLHGIKGVRDESVPQEQRVAIASAEMPLQSGRSVPSEPDILSASINRNTTSKNSPTGQNSLNSQGASRQTEKLPTGGDQSQKSQNDWLEHRIHNPEVEEEGSNGLVARRAHNPKVGSSKTLAFKTRAINNSTTTQKTSDDSGEGRIRTSSSADGTRGTKRSSLYAASPLVPESCASKAAPVRADWPDTTGISEGLLRVCIENARNLAFPGYIRGAQSFRIAS